MRRVLLMTLALATGFVIGITTPAAAAGNYFAGYKYVTQLNAASALLPYGNPSVPFPVDFSSEWVMAYDGVNGYVQAGWLKHWWDGTPYYFFEYDNGCGGFCRYTYGTINTSTHEYKVKLVGSNWCGYIDGTQKDCGSTSTIGFTTAPQALYSGETTDPAAQLGGTGASHYRMTRLSFTNTSGTTYQVNTNNLSLVLTSGTNYHADKGFSSPDTWIDNWTQ